MPAYLIARVNVTDPDKYENYKALAPAAIAQYGGKYLARGGATKPWKVTMKPAVWSFWNFPT
jgi:uncharacterized protein (DUF1330 family)